MSSNTKSGETPIPSQENIPQLCKGNCGFFGSPDQRGLCSVCFKKEVENERKKDEEKPTTVSAHSESSDSSTTAPMTDAMADLMKPQVPEVELKSPADTPKPESPKREVQLKEEEEGTPVASPPAKKQKKKCGMCKKKLGLTGFECRCGKFYCGLHRYSDQHACPFDYKSDGRKQIAAANPAVRGEKVQKL